MERTPSVDSPEAYILRQPAERQPALKRLRDTIRAHLPIGFEESMQYGMITYVVPMSIFPAGYHVNPTDPLAFLSLANQKNYIALYHLGMYAEPDLLEWFTLSYAARNIGKLDMGKSCIRLKNLSNIPYDLFAALCEKLTPEAYIALYQKGLEKNT